MSATNERSSTLGEHRDQLESLAHALLEQETLDEVDAYAAAGHPPQADAPDRISEELAHGCSAPAGTYPRELEADIVLRDGSTAHVRPVRSDRS